MHVRYTTVFAYLELIRDMATNLLIYRYPLSDKNRLNNKYIRSINNTIFVQTKI